MAYPASTSSRTNATAVMPAHPLARAVMRLLSHHDDADLRFVFAAVAKRVKPEGDGRRESALAALERSATELGVPQPTHALRRLAGIARTRSAARHPCSRSARSSAGRGAERSRRCRRFPAATLSCAAWPRRGPKFTDAECLDALRRWHAETGSCTTTSYRDWAQRTRAEGTVRIPASCDPIRDRFGAWVPALDAAGIKQTRHGPQRSRPQRVRGATRDEVAAGLRQVWSRCSHSRPTLPSGVRVLLLSMAVIDDLRKLQITRSDPGRTAGTTSSRYSTHTRHGGRDNPAGFAGLGPGARARYKGRVRAGGVGAFAVRAGTRVSRSGRGRAATTRVCRTRFGRLRVWRRASDAALPEDRAVDRQQLEGRASHGR